MRKKFITAAVLSLAILAGADAPPAAVDVDVSKLLNMRFCAVVKDGSIVPLTADVDGAGGLATESAAKALNNPDPHALPDDGHFAANDKHPAVTLHYSNDDAISMQARRCTGKTDFSFDVPPQAYTQMFLWMMSGQGPSNVEIELTYADGSTDSRSMQVPDWFWDVKADDKDHCFLVSDLGKWSKDSKMIEKRHHAIFGLLLHPANKPLKSIKVSKSAKGIMVFYGATGQVAPAK